MAGLLRTRTVQSAKRGWFPARARNIVLCLALCAVSYSLGQRSGRRLNRRAFEEALKAAEAATPYKPRTTLDARRQLPAEGGGKDAYLADLDKKAGQGGGGDAAAGAKPRSDVALGGREGGQGLSEPQTGGEASQQDQGGAAAAGGVEASTAAGAASTAADSAAAAAEQAKPEVQAAAATDPAADTAKAEAKAAAEQAVAIAQAKEAQGTATTMDSGGAGTGATGEQSVVGWGGEIVDVEIKPPFKPSGEPVTTQVCSDTCASAKNGVCEEGRAKVVTVPVDVRDPDLYPATCDLGTDCSDCGPWSFTGSQEALKWTPVKDIQAKQATISVRQIAVPKPFWIAFTDPNHDTGVSRSIYNDAMLDPEVTVLMHKILKQGCIGPKGERRLVMDIGANFGYWTLFAASMGCRVVAWEPVPHFAAFLEYGLLRNNLTHLVELRHAIVGDDHLAKLLIVAPKRGSWGTAGVNGVNIDKWVDNEGPYDQLRMTSERTDQIVKENVLLMKVSAEGFEPWAMKSAEHLLLDHLVENIYFEYRPNIWERQLEWGMAVHFPMAVGRLHNHNYTMYHIHEGTLPKVFDAELEPLDYADKRNIKHDIEDIYRLQNGTLGCPLPQQLVGMWECNQIPEALHPHSFRSTFDRGTRLWAMHQDAQAKNFSRTGQPAGLFPLEYEVIKFFTLRMWGTGRRLCADLEPNRRVAHRCRCRNHKDCARQETIAFYLGRQGKVPPLNATQEADVDHLFVGNW
ncbi:hypothetical protein N2152v2_006881 [Parachlorella kessleri]